MLNYFSVKKSWVKDYGIASALGMFIRESVSQRLVTKREALQLVHSILRLRKWTSTQTVDPTSQDVLRYLVGSLNSSLQVEHLR